MAAPAPEVNASASVIGAVIIFTPAATAVCFVVVLPLNAYNRRETPEGEPVPSEAELLTYP